MGYKKKTWKEKLEDNKGYPKKLKLEPNFPCYKALEKMGAWPGDSVVIAPPREVYELMEKVPWGKLVVLEEICRALAKKHNVQYLLHPDYGNSHHHCCQCC